MRFKKSIVAVAMSAASVAALAEESKFGDLSGEVAFATSYRIVDGYEATDNPVVQPWLIMSLGGECQAEVWNSTGLTTNTGNETEVGFTCTKDWYRTTVGVYSLQYFLHGENDITDVTVFAEYGNWYVSVSKFWWHGGNPDAWRTELGYTFEVTSKLDLKLGAVFGQGYGETDTLSFSAEASYHFNDSWSVSISAMNSNTNYFKEHPNDVDRDSVVGKLIYSF